MEAGASVPVRMVPSWGGGPLWDTGPDTDWTGPDVETESGASLPVRMVPAWDGGLL